MRKSRRFVDCYRGSFLPRPSLRLSRSSDAMRIGVWLGVGCLLPSFTPYTDAHPIPIELFESQGCSSCPPAEKVLQDLENEFGSDILPLSFHVDYWDRLGWKDPFSSAEATHRQEDYAKAFQQREMYTPELVIEGESGFVGSDRQRARKEIEKRLHVSHPEFAIQAKGSLDSRSLTISFQLPEALAQEKPRVTVVVYENAPSVSVKKGENKGVEMSGQFAVRDFWTIPGRLSPVYQVPIRLNPSWNPERTGVALLVQGTSSSILAAQRYFPVLGAFRP